MAFQQSTGMPDIRGFMNPFLIRPPLIFFNAPYHDNLKREYKDKHSQREKDLFPRIVLFEEQENPRSGREKRGKNRQTLHAFAQLPY